MNLLPKNVISEYYIIHQPIDKLLNIDNKSISKHICESKALQNPFDINWEINVSRIFQHQMDQFDADYERFTFLKSLQGIHLKANQFYHKKTYIDEFNLLDSPDMTLIYHAEGDDLKIRFVKSHQRAKNREYDYDLKPGQLVMFNSSIEHIIFDSKTENSLLLVHYQHQYS